MKTFVNPHEYHPNQNRKTKEVPIPVSNNSGTTDTVGTPVQTVPLNNIEVKKTTVQEILNSKIMNAAQINSVVDKIRRNKIMAGKRAVKFGVVGLGQGGCRLAGEFEKLGYPTLAINTSEQDLNECPCKERVLIGSGGAGRDLKNGASAVNLNRSKIMSEYQRVLNGIDHAIVCAGSSGGTGGGGLSSIIDTLRDYKVPVGVITTLPLDTEDTRSKKNTLAVLNELIKANAEKKITPLIIVDNNKIEKKHPGLSTLDFWIKANEEVVKCFDLFNMLSAKTSAYTSFDPADYKKVLNSGGCMIFGNITVEGEIGLETVADAIRKNIDGGLLAEGFNLVEATHAAIVMVGNPDQLRTFPRLAEEKAFSVLTQMLGSGTVFKGVYGLPAVSNFETFFMISGLGLPVSRIKSLIESSKIESAHLEKKATLRTVDDIMRDLEQSEGSGS